MNMHIDEPRQLECFLHILILPKTRIVAKHPELPRHSSAGMKGRFLPHANFRTDSDMARRFDSKQLQPRAQNFTEERAKV